MNSKLQLLAVFFGDAIVYQIFVRTQVIHRLFEGSEELDIHKLELFHLQYTISVIELLKKIKKANEHKVLLIHDEIHLNKELIQKIDDRVITRAEREEEEQRQTGKMSISLRKLYRVMAEGSDEYPFSSNVAQFSSQFASVSFVPVSEPIATELISFNPTEVYHTPHVIIHRKLLGLLHKNQFQIAFHTGLLYGDSPIEIYELADTKRYFLFMPAKTLFLLCSTSAIEALPNLPEVNKEEKVLLNMAEKNRDLEREITSVKKHLPDDIRALLADYSQRIAANNFLEQLMKVDVQANILRAMLNTNEI